MAEMDPDSGFSNRIVQFYKATKRESEERLQDETNQKPQFSLKYLARALENFKTTAKTFGAQKDLYEGFCKFFLTLLDRPGANVMHSMIVSYIPGGSLPKDDPFGAYFYSSVGFLDIARELVDRIRQRNSTDPPGLNHLGDMRAAVPGQEGSDRMIKVWSFDGISEDDDMEIALKSKAVIAAHDKDINSLAISPNDTSVCSGSEDHAACIWRHLGQTFVAALKGHKRGIWSMKFSPGDQCVLTSSGDRTIKIWALAVGKKTEKLATEGTDAVINSWHDCTAVDKQEAILRGQELENA